ncbi:MAG: small, acid-soluble spore protein, alpha/beta type [Eubacteriales bacterium]|nr:small, acid-soluble spore protein, alpha/beta type [Eubacteriales bacterium]
MKKEKKIDLTRLKDEEKMKYEIAGELGLLDRVLTDGWKSLTAKETGRIGGLMTKRKKERERSEEK